VKRVFLPATVALALMALAPAALSQTINDIPFDKQLKLAKVGDEEAQLAVGLAYESGTAGKTDLAEAARWFRQAGLQGNIEAQFRLARIVVKGTKGLKQDLPTALRLFKVAAEKNHPGAMNAYGQMLQNGQGMTADPAKAAEWYKKAAEAGLADAQNNLGMMYLNGKGVTRDLKEAFRLFELAAKQGDAWGLNNLGGMYEVGWGVAQDREKALDLYRQAAAKGNEGAAANLKRLVPEDRAAVPAAGAAAAQPATTP
jgi:TPR repeat protein